MRIGVMGPRQPPTIGGGFTFQATVMQALACIESKHEFVLLDGSGSGAGDWLRDSLTVIDLDDMRPSQTASEDSSSVTDHAARKLGLDVVWYLDPMAEVLSVPVFATVLDLAHRLYPFFPEVSTRGWKWNAREDHYRTVLPRAARIFTGTKTGKEQIIRFYGVNPANIVVNPFPASKFEEPGDLLRGEEVLAEYSLAPGFLFYPAQFWPHKNHFALVKALKLLESHHGFCPELVLTGTDHGNLAHVRQLVSESGLEEHVHFLGFVPSSHVKVLYEHAAALVFPSFFGPDNLPPLEAFALGCPVIAARIEGAEDQLGGGTAAFFDPARPGEIASAIMRVLTDSEYSATLVEHGKQVAAERSPEAYVQVVLRTLDAFERFRLNWPALDPAN